MNIQALLSRCLHSGVRLGIHHGELRVHFSGEIQDAELLPLLREHKQELLQHLLQLQAPGAFSLPVLPLSERTRFPASSAQRRMWLLDQWEGAGAAYNMIGAYRLRGAFDARAMQATLDAVVTRHESLRTVFSDVDGEIHQLVQPPASVPFDQLDWSGLPAEQQEQAWRHLLERENNGHFDLATGPLLRVTCADFGAGTWALLLNVHHIACDGWSIDILERDISTFYAAFVAGRPAEPAPPAIQYVDYVAWSRRGVDDAARQAQLDYWKTTLEGMPPLHGLPLDKPRPPIQAYAGGTIRRTLPMSWLRTALDYCQGSGATLFMYLHAALAATLSRYANERDIVVGFPVAGRQHRDLDATVGLFVNTLVLRTHAQNDLAFSDLLATSRRAVIAALEHQEVPYDALVEALHPERSLSYSPLIQIFLTLQSRTQDGLRLQGLDVEALGNPEAQVKLDLQIEAVQSNDGLAIDWRFNRSLFDDASMTRMVDSLVRLLEAVADQPEQPLSSLPTLLAPAERRLLLDTWNQTDAPYPADRCIHQWFEEQVRRDPGAVALVFEDQTLSYDELNTSANRLAHYLIERGVRPDDRVAVCAERSIIMVVGLLAILKAGGAYVSLDPAAPSARQAQILRDATPALMLVDHVALATLGEAARHAREVIVLDQADAAWIDYPGSNPDPSGLGSRHLVYVIYTSGSTGTPKGVMVEHRSLANLIAWHGQRFNLRPGSRSTSIAGLTFDACVWEIWPLLTHGGTLLLPPRPLAHDTAATLQWWRQQRMESAFLITPLASLLLAEGGLPEGLHDLLIGGDRLASLPAGTGALRLINNYGPTEATVVATSGLLTAADALVHIGRPISNTRIYLLDAQGQPVPLGAVGELYIGGVGVARGYLNRPELTAERFLPDPFVADPEARLYRTGDLARYLPDGNLVFLGRNDHQVKIRGFRIELGEIEARLAEHPDVRDAVVLALGDDTLKRLVAYVVPADEADALARLTPELREHLARGLPGYMVPAAFVLLPALPLTPNGKLDRQALPAPDDDAFARHAYEPPCGEIEVALTAIWQELLGVERIGRHDHFFELGGHSLLAVRLLSRLVPAFGLELPLAELFTHPTVSALAAVIEQRTGEAATHLAPITPTPRDGALALSFAQQRLWFLAQIEGVSATYHIPAALRLRGTLDTAALRRALDALFARHEALRTVFVAVDGQPQATLLPAAQPFTLHEHDLQAHPDPAAALARASQDEALAPFDLAHGPLIRGRLLRLASDDHVLLMTQHHIVSDGWSLGILVHELSALYRAFTLGQPDPLPPLSIQYPDYAAWQRHGFTGERLADQLDYWHRTLADAPVLLTLPTDRPRSVAPSYAGASVPIVLDAALTRALKRLGQQHDTTLFMTLLAAWAAVLGRLAAQPDVVIGIPSANRGRHEIEPLVGFFVNTLALRIDLAGEPTVADLLARVRRVALAAQDHQDVPFEQVVERVNPPRRLEHTPLFQVMFAWQNNELDDLDLPGLQVEAIAADFDRIKFDLELTLNEVGDTVQGSLSYACDLFDAATIERQRGYLLTLLQAMVEPLDQPIARIDLLADDERTRLLHTWNRTDAPYPADRCIHQLFEEQVRRAPEAIALRFGEETLAYAALNAQANRLAHYLIERGVRPDDRVAICVERSFAMLVGLLAILKAGGAYVPLDPAYPSARLGQTLADADPAIVLVDAAGRASLEETALHGRHVLDLAQPQPAWREHPAADPNPASLGLTARHLAYVIYTSGSTGTPKGVMIEHRNVCHQVHALQGAYGLTADDRLLQFTSISFDMSVEEIFPALLSGATLVLRMDQYLSSPAAFVEFCSAHRLTSLNLPSTFWTQLALAQPAPEFPPTLRQVSTGGDAMSLPAVAAWFGRTGHRPRLFNAYGPTETTVNATMLHVEHALHTGSIGRPIANTKIYLLDEYGQPVPFGTVGELYIGGAGVARGYLHRPQLSAERFLIDAFSGEPDARMYRTGDLARYLPDGNLEFLGRNDHQIKIRGFRIELGEIEARLAEHPSVGEAVVIARGAGNDKRLVAYLVVDRAAANESSLVGTWRTHLAATLPDFMIPVAFVRLDAFPLTPNGKLDRQALPAPDDDAFARHAYEPPCGEIEVALTAIWQELLGVERIGRHDHFFELGGHSLLAVRLLSRLVPAFGLELPLAELFTHPTVSALAAVIEQRTGEAATRLAPITPTSRDGALALSFAQQRLWFLAQIEGVSATYHIPAALRLRGTLETAALRRALDALFARHEALRTVFVAVDGQPQATLLPAAQPFTLHEHDLQAHPDPAAALARASQDEALAPFDLAHGPLIRGRLLRLAPDDHVLLMTQHHIVSDGWSLGILVHELSALYRAFTRGQPDPLPPLPIQYPDYAAWQRHGFTGERLADQLDYWHRALADAPVLLTLPTDRPRSVAPSYAGASVPIVLDAALTRALKRLGQQHDTTLFMTLLAAWAAVLGRLAAQPDVVIGIPSANRGRHEIEPLVGFFVNTLALRIDLAGEPTVADLLARVRRVALAAQDHQDVPFEQVVERVNPPRRLEHTPLFQVMFAWQNNELDDLDLPGLQVEAIAADFDRIKFDLELTLNEVGDTVQGSLSYACDLFDAATIERQRGYLLTLLQAMVEPLDQPIARIDLLADDERTRLLHTWNRTDAPYPADRCIHQLFEEQVRRAPEAIALRFGEHALTYAALNAQANRLAHYLIEHDVRPDDRVAICVERSFAMLVGLLAILKAGGAYVPLDPAYPSARLGQTLADADPAIVLVDAAGRAALEETALHGRHVLDLAQPQPAWREHSAADPDPASLGLSARHLAYVIYTSGSTGTPKGAQNEHRALINRLVWMQEAYRLDADDVVIQKTPFGFDVSVWEFFWTLLNGATLALAPPEAHKDPAALIELIVHHRVTTAHFVPSMLAVFLHAEGVERCTTLRRLVCSGEALIGSSVRRTQQQLPQASLYNLYGPTEAAIDVTAWTCPAGFAEEMVPIGRPISNTRIYLLDAQGQPVPLGAVGELYIGGVGVARGYLNRPELTAERFLPDPFVADPEARLYRSGDLARYLPDGNLVFLGRNDHQVKIRGFRIELGEIEARLAEHPDVRDAVVLALGDDTHKRLVAYVVPVDEADALARLTPELREHLARGLPDYMVPAAFVLLPALPLTANGKLDRQALPAPDDDAFARHAYEPPCGEVEIALTAIWQELLGVERIGRHDHFFELGGHSLLAVRLLSRLVPAFGLELPLAELFTHPTVSALAAVIERRTGEAATHLAPITPTPRDGALALSFAQQRLWFLAQIEGVSATYHIPAALRLRGTLDTAALRRALDALFARHEALRTVFVAVDGQPQATLLPAAQPFTLHEHDLQAHPDPAAALARASQDEALAPFDLAHGPLIRGRLLRLASDDHVLLMTQHHIVSDGWSLGILVHELSALYRAFTLGQPDPLPPLSIQYPDYAAWQRHGFTGERLADQLDYWHRTLADAPVLLTLPTDRPRSVAPSYAGASVPIVLDAALTRALKRLGQQHDTTLFMTLLAAWAAVLGRLAAQPDVVIGIPSANRGRHEIEPLVGFFVNTLALRIDLAGEPTVADLLARVRRVALAAQDHQDVPFEQVVERVNPPRRLEHTPLFQVMFAWQNNELDDLDLPGLQVEAIAADFDRIKFDLELTLNEVGDTVQGSLSYACDLFDPATIERQCGYLLTLLQAMVEPLDQPIARIDLLADDERTRLLHTWNRTDAPYPADRCIHQLFEEQVRRAPDAIALRLGEHALTYAALNAQANRLAHYLIEHGVRPDDRVAICVERSFAMLVGLLAILKAGGAYVPLDPAYPSARLGQTLADADPAIVLVDAAGRAALEETALHGRHVLDLAQPQPAWREHPEADPDPASLGLTARHLAYVIYTSGSTGTPKGVMIEHRQLLNYFSWALPKYYQGEVGRGSPATLSFAFDGSVTVLFGPLLSGQTLSLLPAGREFESLAENATAGSYAALKLTPTHLRMLSHLLAETQAAAPAGRLILGGEMLTSDDLRFWQQNHPQVELINEYGPTETTIGCAYYLAGIDHSSPGPVAIGRPIANTRIYLLDAYRQPVPLGSIGEIHIGGAGVARGYLNRPDLTAERFLIDPFADEAGARMYRTGDLARQLPNGDLVYLGRNDDQIKLRGFRIELGDIEACLGEHPAVRNAVVLAQGESAHKQLVAYIVPAADQAPENLAADLRAHLAARLPDYMVPAAFMTLAALPLSPNGKLDRRALPAPGNEAYAHRAYAPPQGKLETILVSIWQTLLEIERVGIHDNFFEIGGTSMHTILLIQCIRERTGFEVSITDLFAYPTIAKLAVHLQGDTPEDIEADTAIDQRAATGFDGDIAVIGMAGRFPGAASVEAFWNNIAAGVESLQSYTREELLDAGTDPALLDHPQFVPMRSLVDGVADFDADYFGFTPREAEVTDPQQRLLLECAHDALESAGYGDAKANRSVGVFVGVGENQYVLDHLLPQIDAFEGLGAGVVYANSKDFAATRISYKLNLSGPSISLNTACSTSLVAIHQACRSLAAGESRMALAGAASIGEFAPGGYVYQEGDILSPDGHCRAFDRDARGTRQGNGVGVVLLKRLEQALADGDTIHAVIKGSALNNDGSDKVGYTAPSVTGQARAIGQAYRNAGVSPGSIQYVEAHGTGTVLGDPIELRALGKAFAGVTAQSCAIGTVKPNIGHLDTAAGVAGLIKTVKALQHRQLPPSINYLQANPQIDFTSSPFYVNTQLHDWPAVQGPLRAGVSSFGIGGTNVHVVLEEAPATQPESASRAVQLLVLSARSSAALQAASLRLADYLGSEATASLADVAYTLQAGRTTHAYRRAIVCETAAEAIAALTLPAAETQKTTEQDASLIWMFPGQGSQHVEMTRGLYASEPVFREQLDACAEALREPLGMDLRELLYPSPEAREEAARQLKQTWLAQPALFAVEYSLAMLLQSYGLVPQAMIGHSLGEYVAACLAGVFSSKSALRLVAARGRLMQQMADGRMLSVPEDEARLRARLADSVLSVAAINGPAQCVVSGAIEAIEALRERLAIEGIESRELETSHAFHSAMMEPMLAAWRDVLKETVLSAPTIPYVSNLSGGFIRAEEATDPEYWVRHLRETVRFGDGLEILLSPDAPLRESRVLVEVGPGQVLSGLARRRLHGKAGAVVPLLGRATMATDDARALHQGIGQLWLHGATIAWASYHGHRRRQRVPLPTYPFERQRYWVEAPARGARTASGLRHASQEDWFYAPLWRLRGSKARTRPGPAPETQTWVVISDRNGMGGQLADRLRHAGHNAILVRQADTFKRISRDEYTLVADDERHHHELFIGTKRDGLQIDHLVHMGALDPTPDADPPEADLLGFDMFEEHQRSGYYSLMFAIKALVAQQPGVNVACHAITHDAFRVTGSEELAPECATISGLCRVAPQEYSNLRCRQIDFSRSERQAGENEFHQAAGAQLFNELTADATDKLVAFRGNERWTQTFEQQRVPTGSAPPRIKHAGVYAITGGLGQVGYALAEHLAAVAARLVIIVRDELPDRSLWKNWIAEHTADDPTARKLERLIALETKGAQVLACRADVADQAQMLGAFEQAEAHFGTIDGVIHCAGQVRESVTSLSESGVDNCRAQFLPKVKGVMVLEQALKYRRVDFCVLMSSLSAVLGGLGFAAYAAANAYMDAFAAARHAQGDETWLSINWDGWRLSGSDDAAGKYSVSGPEGARALDYALSWADVPQLVHSTGDLKTRMEKWIDRLPSEPAGMRLYVRSSETSSVAPSTTIEFQLVEIWQQLLGLEDVGVRDGFFQLGGDSLLATMLIARINKAFKVNLPIRIVFEEETIERIALQIDELTKRPPQGKPLALKRTGHRHPLFCIHPGSGFGRPYLTLLKHLASDLPVYALEARGLNDGDVLPATMSDMCADYIEQIQVIQPAGPYQLLGWSFGAVAAHAIAAEMRKRGLAVGKLILIDATPLDDEPWPEESIAAHRHDLEGRLSTYKDYKEASDDFKNAMLERLTSVYCNNVRLSYYRDPAAFDGNTLMITSTLSEKSDKYFFYKKHFLGNVREIDTPYHHNKLLTEEAVESYAYALRDFLEEGKEKSAIENELSVA